MLPDLDEHTRAYLTYQYRKRIDKPSDIDGAYHLAWEWLVGNVDSNFLKPGKIPGAVVEAAIFNLHFRLTASATERNAASFAMYALIERYAKDCASRMY